MTEPRIIRERYQIERTLQLGPLATTYLARDNERDETRVVLKQLSIHGHGHSHGQGAHREAGELLARYKLLEREAKILRNLEHPGIPTFIDTFHTEDQGRTSIWLVQEYREGRTLRDMVEDGWHGSAEDIVEIVCKVAEILSYLHSRVPPIVHRDVKPANIIVGPDGDVSLVDLGAACTRVLEDRRGSTIVGTPGYVPMEQFVGQAVPASDVYALGMVGVFLITHEEPLSLIREDGTVHYRHLATLEHPTLLPAIDRMIEPTVDRRPRNGQAVLEHLRGEADDAGAGATSESDADHGKTRPRAWTRPLAYAAAMALMLAAAVGGTYAYMVHSRSADDALVEVVVADEELGMWPETDEAVPEPADEIAQLLAAPPHSEPPPEPACVVTRENPGGDAEASEDLECTPVPVVVAPMVVAPGRIRLVLDSLPESVLGDAEEPPAPGTSEDSDSTIYWVVDATLDGFEVLGALGCPNGSEVAATSLDHQGRVHAACLDYVNQAYLVVFDSKRENAWVRGSYALAMASAIADYMGYGDNMDSGPNVHLAVPERGPALLVFQAFDDMGGLDDKLRVQPLARGSTAFDLFPQELSEIGEWVLYSEAGQVYALVRARRRGENVRGLHKVGITALGSRMAGTLQLSRSTDGDVFCHRITTAHADGSLLIRSPNEFGDQTLEATLRGAHAIPGPDTASTSTHVCGNGAGVFVKVGAKEARFVHEDMAYAHQLSCRGEQCLMVHHDPAMGTVVTPFTMQ